MANTTLDTRILLKGDTAANWANSSLVLLKNEVAIESDTRKIKIGDGTNTFASLSYANLTPEEINSLISAVEAVADSKIGSVTLATGTNNGTLKITIDGNTTDNIAVKGLGSAAYTSSSAYATAAQGTLASNAMPKSGGTFTGTVTLKADPTTALGAATKQYVDAAETAANEYTDTAIANLVNGAPTTLDTLKEIADAMAENEDVVAALEEAIGTKANASDLTSHTGNTTVHITASERTKWNSAEANQNAFSNITVGSTTIAADSETDTLTLVAGTNVTITPDATNDKITIAATNTDSKVKNTLATTTKAYITGTTSATTSTGEQVFDTGVYLDTTAGMLTAATFKGALSGNATTASSASKAAQLTTARTIATSGGAAGTATSFNGTANITIPITKLDTDYLVVGANTLILNGGGAS